MKSFVFILLSFSFCVTTFAQKHDYNWLMGYGAETSPDSTFGLSQLDFNNDPLSVNYRYSQLNFSSSNTTFSDSAGNLLFYSNGLEIYNAEHTKLLNSQQFNDSPYHNDFYDTGLRLVQAVITLPSSENNNKYYVFHLKLELEYTMGGDSLYFYCPGLYYTTIDMTGDNDLGVVVEKGVPIIEDTLALGELTATRHANGRDWWLLMPELDSNRYYRILLNAQGIQLLESQTIGTPTYAGLGQAVFSPDGKWYVRNNMLGNYEDDDYLDIYQFDRCTGLLSNHIRFSYGYGVSSGGGTAISSNNRFLYIGHLKHVYQYDLESDNIEASKDTIAIWDGYYELDFLGTTFFLGQLAPDGKIYFNTTNSNSLMHLIHNPNGQGNNCRFEQRGMDLPTYNAFSLPNFPNYRLGPVDGSPCDSLGIDNLPLAAFNYYADSSDYLTIHFWDYSFYEPTEWEWSFGDSEEATGQTPVHTYPEPGIYEVCLTASNEYGSDSICKWLEFSPVGVKEILPEGGQVLVYPNPAREEVILQFQETLSSAAVFNLYNALGQRVVQQSITEGSGKSSIPVSDIIPGIYFYSVGSKGVIMDSGKLVVEH